MKLLGDVDRCRPTLVLPTPMNSLTLCSWVRLCWNQRLLRSSQSPLVEQPKLLYDCLRCLTKCSMISSPSPGEVNDGDDEDLNTLTSEDSMALAVKSVQGNVKYATLRQKTSQVYRVVRSRLQTRLKGSRTDMKHIAHEQLLSPGEDAILMQ